jgi:molybdenum cofactor guanylyltransferase
VYDRGMDGVNGFVLAGGQSTRMGTDKAFLELNGETLLNRALDLARATADRVWIVGNREKFATFGPVIEDQFPNHGPLAGIHAALRGSNQDLNLILAVDTPFIENRFLKYLSVQAKLAQTTVTVPRAQGRLQPLCAIYRKQFADLAERALLAGQNRIDPLFSQVESRILEEAELREHDFPLAMFRNLNTPQDLLVPRNAS